MPLLIATWNVNSIKARADHVKRFLSERSPDILMVQELKGENLPEISDDYDAYFVGQKAYNGVAIFVKKNGGSPVDLIHSRLGGDESDEQARYIELDWNGIRLIDIYLPNGNPVSIDSEKFPYKIRWMDRLFNRVSELRAAQIPFLIGGDFNVIPEDQDCYDPKAWDGDALFHPQTHEKWRALLNLGLVDAFRVLHPFETESYSFWDYQAGAWQKNNGIRIDHFLLSPALADRLESCRIDREPRGWEKASDHTPVLIEISES
ncbi:MAG TPA: exodeoxyribonuclease III [Alphaproteobacteria bacterium]|nr:exodeoxyribonuclease III [Alphaproteobacteria bacterium]HOO50030.1 exodeoxyribonuclease III [Alphaproteobacteria bacterium]